MASLTYKKAGEVEGFVALQVRKIRRIGTLYPVAYMTDKVSTKCVSIRSAGVASAAPSSPNSLAGPVPSLPIELEPDFHRMVRALAGRLHARLPQGCGIDVGDLVQAGNVGLLKAVQAFEVGIGSPILSYAKFRVRGEMLDLVRKHLGRDTRTFSALARSSGDAEIPASGDSCPQSPFFTRQRAAVIQEELERLPAKYRALVRLRYAGELTLREIGAQLHVNESRVCQLHQKALIRLKKALHSRGVSGFTQL